MDIKKDRKTLTYAKTTSAGIVRNLKHWNKNLHFPVNETLYFQILHLRLAFSVSCYFRIVKHTEI